MPERGRRHRPERMRAYTLDLNHAPSQDITEGYAADWTMAQLRDAAQRIADRIDELIRGTGPAHEAASKIAFHSFAGSAASS